MSRITYSRSAIALHWAIALLLAMQLGLGWRMVSLPKGEVVYAAFQLHKSIGILILLASLARVIIRMTQSRPGAVDPGSWTARLAGLVHALLYLFMIGGPLTGWAVVSTSHIPVQTRLFGKMSWPNLPIAAGWHDQAAQSHEILAWLGALLIAMHVAGAFRHHFGPAEGNVIGRMIPVTGTAAGKGRVGSLLGGVVAAGCLCVVGLVPWLVYSPRIQPAVLTPDVRRPAVPASTVSIAPAVAISSPLPTPSAAASEGAGDSVVTGWGVDKGGHLGFAASVNGSTVSGRFSRWDAAILFDLDKLDQSHLSVQVDLLSASTDDADRDQMLKGSDFFGNAPGGKAVFHSSVIRHIERDRYFAQGTLVMNGKSLPLAIGFALHIDGGKAKVTGSTTIDRTLFGVGSGQWAAVDQIAADVAVDFAFTAHLIR
jgi:cytochrome b561/polyisoprenoid-binding protein YceI